MCPHYTVCPPESTDELNVQLQTIQLSTYNAHNSLKEEEEAGKRRRALWKIQYTILSSASLLSNISKNQVPKLRRIFKLPPTQTALTCQTPDHTAWHWRSPWSHPWSDRGRRPVSCQTSSTDSWHRGHHGHTVHCLCSSHTIISYLFLFLEHRKWSAGGLHKNITTQSFIVDLIHWWMFSLMVRGWKNSWLEVKCCGSKFR